MSHLNKVSKGKVAEPLFGIVYGVEGIGKSTFGAQLPDVIFHGPEKSNKFDVARFESPKTFDEACAQIRELIDSEHSFKSICIDSIDHLEHILISDICKRDGVDAIEQSFGDFGKWVGGLTKIHMSFINLLKELREKKKMNILLLAHYQVKRFDDPSTPVPYDRYNMKMSNEKIAALYREAVDFVFFANFKVAVKTDNAKAKKGKGVGGEARVIYTEKRAAHDAKNRFSLPYEMPFDYAAVVAKINEAEIDVLANLRTEIEDIILDITDETLSKQAKETLEKFKTNADALKQVKNRLLAATASK